MPRASRSSAVISCDSDRKIRCAAGSAGTVIGSTAVAMLLVRLVRLPVRPTPAARCDQQQRLQQRRRRAADAGAGVLVGVIVVGLQDDEARERAVGDVGRLQRAPEVQRRRGAVDAQAGLVDVAALVAAVAVGVLGAEKDGAGGGVELGHGVEDVGDVPWAAPAIGRGREQHAELVELEQDGGLAVQGGQEARAAGDAVAAEEVSRARLPRTAR